MKAMPVGWFESPHGAFRANPDFRMEWPPQTLDWQVPVYFGRRPFSEDQIKRLVGASDQFWSTSRPWIISIFRAIEQAHGIEYSESRT